MAGEHAPGSAGYDTGFRPSSQKLHGMEVITVPAKNLEELKQAVQQWLPPLEASKTRYVMRVFVGPGAFLEEVNGRLLRGNTEPVTSAVLPTVLVFTDQDAAIQAGKPYRSDDTNTASTSGAQQDAGSRGASKARKGAKGGGIKGTGIKGVKGAGSKGTGNKGAGSKGAKGARAPRPARAPMEQAAKQQEEEEAEARQHWQLKQSTLLPVCGIVAMGRPVLEGKASPSDIIVAFTTLERDTAIHGHMATWWKHGASESRLGSRQGRARMICWGFRGSANVQASVFRHASQT